MNAIIKGQGGAISSPENDNAQQQWLISGPEVARVIGASEATLMQKTERDDTEHHEKTQSTQTAYVDGLKDDSSDLLLIDSKIVMNDATVAPVLSAQDQGRKNYKQYSADRMWRNQPSPGTCIWQTV